GAGFLPVAKEIRDIWRAYRQSPGRQQLRTFRVLLAERPSRSEELAWFLGTNTFRLLAKHTMISPKLGRAYSDATENSFGLELGIAYDPGGEVVWEGDIYTTEYEERENRKCLREWSSHKDTLLDVIKVGKIYAVPYVNSDSSQSDEAPSGQTNRS